MDIDNDKLDEAVLALLYLTLHDENDLGGRAWKGHDWDVLNRLYERELISDPRSKAKSVWLSREAIDKAKAAFERLFARTTDNANRATQVALDSAAEITRHREGAASAAPETARSRDPL